MSKPRPAHHRRESVQLHSSSSSSSLSNSETELSEYGSHSRRTVSRRTPATGTTPTDSAVPNSAVPGSTAVGSTLDGEEIHEYPFIQRQKPLGPPILHLHNISKQYKLPGREKAVEALKRIDLNRHCEFDPLREGEFLMVRGASGGGKTTLLNIIGTIDKPTTGELILLGHKITSKSSDSFLSKLRLKHMGFVFQTFNLIATMSAFENVELPMTLNGKLSKKKRRQRAKELLKSVGLEDRMGHLPSELSGGEQQRVTIARALANKPEMLILDEATASLDTASTIEVMNLILDINLKHKTTVVCVTHNPDLECYADRIVYVKDGRFVKQVVNTIQTPLIYDYYQQYLKEHDRGG